jgi:hypothetical protein
MLADRARVLVLLLLASITTLVVVGGVVIVGHSNEHVDSEIAGLSREIHGVLSVERARPNSVDTLFVVMRDEVEWTGVVEESDWSKVCQITWDGPIRTWTTMRKVRVPSLDNRMIESIEPVGTEHNAIYVHLRVIVPGDVDAALAWIRSRPEVESAALRIE